MLKSQEKFGHLWVWEDMQERLPWYYQVALNQMPAKYLICRRIGCEIEFEGAEEKELWQEHERLTSQFLDLYGRVRRKELELNALPPRKHSLLELNSELAERMLQHCNFCRWNCKVNRAEGAKHGTCQLESVSRVGSYFHHGGEELVFRGTAGSGTIFFTSCNMRCQFCQNGDISHDKNNGIPITPKLLAIMAWQLRMEGCHNINLVGGEPTIHLHTIMEAISLLGSVDPTQRDLQYAQQVKSDWFQTFKVKPENAYWRGEFNAPVLWNSNFFMSEEAMKLLRTVVDIWLPDFKFGCDKCSVFLSRTPWYFETVSRNHQTIHDWGEDAVIRHLVMPNHVECCTKPVLKWISENTRRFPVNIMDQYHPDYACDPANSNFNSRYTELSRRPYQHEVLEAYAYAKKLGVCFETVSLEKNVTGFTL